MTTAPQQSAPRSSLNQGSRPSQARIPTDAAWQGEPIAALREQALAAQQAAKLQKQAISNPVQLALSYEFGHALEPTAGTPKAELATVVRAAEDEFTSQTTDNKVDNNWHVGQFVSQMGKPAYEDAVARTIAYIHAGDIFQANIAHHLVAPFRGCARSFAQNLLTSTSAPQACLFHASPTTLYLSLSPELLVHYDASTRLVRTRPIKGTRPAHIAHELRTSTKDHAELTMITDLMRNDIGRVAEPGSVRVTQPRVYEPHGPIVHAVSEVQATLARGYDAFDLIGAAFPAGSITGAPKVRAMQIINELEPAPRSIYCGSLGELQHDGSLTLSVAIRTATITLTQGTIDDENAAGTITFPVGAGIVADSDPSQEWQETLDKAAGFVSACNTTIAHP